VLKATGMTDGYGMPIWRTWRTGVRARIQPESTKIVSGTDAPHTTASYRIFVEEDLELDHTCCVRGPDGARYTVTGASRIGEVQVIDAEIGRLSRAAPDKFSPNTWRIYGRVPGPIAARVMGWDASVAARVGWPPAWAECLPAGAETPQAFLAQVHCLAVAGGEAVENWPRVGLEAMAAGVPLVVQRQGGWPEMIRRGETGYLCGSDEEMTDCIARLASDPAERRRIVGQARAAVENELANPDVLWRQWRELFEELQA
jgi:glycosyltransferase involved in cell wall biosynthesis